MGGVLPGSKVTGCKLLQSKEKRRRGKEKKKKFISTCVIFLNTLLHFWYFVITPS